MGDILIPNVTGSLCTASEVKRVGHLTNEFSVGEVASYIDDAKIDVIDDYGEPIKKIFTYIDQEYYYYWLGQAPIYRIDNVTIDDGAGSASVLPIASWCGSLTQGYVTLASEVVNNHPSKKLTVNFVPRIYNLIAKNLAALNMLEALNTTSGPETSNPNISRIRTRLNMYKMRAKGGYAIVKSTDYSGWDIRRGEYVRQDRQNVY